MAEQLLGRSTQAKLDGPLDWDQWQGPAQHRVPLDPFRFRNWRYISDYAGGVVADQGAHIFDGINMLKHAGFPEAVTAAAGKPHKAGADTPESVAVTAEYADDFVAVFTINYAAMRYRNRNDQLNPYDGDKARMDIGREEFKVYMQGAEETPAIAKKSERGLDFATDLHFRNFIDCMRTRNTPTAPMALGFQATLAPQIANLSLRHGRRVPWNGGRVEL